MTAFVIIDTETSGLDPEKGELLEVGAVLFDADHGTTLSSYATLLRAEANAAEAINRIPSAVLAHGEFRHEVVENLHYLLDRENVYILAHRAEFDRAWLPELDDERWICTKEEAEWPLSDRDAPSLVHLALAYDVGVVRAHRAIEDCLTLAAVLSRVHQVEGGLEDWLRRALEPRVELIAQVHYRDRQLAKDAGFRWDGDRKLWVKQVRKSKVKAYRRELSFPTDFIPPIPDDVAESAAEEATWD